MPGGIGSAAANGFRQATDTVLALLQKVQDLQTCWFTQHMEIGRAQIVVMLMMGMTVAVMVMVIEMMVAAEQPGADEIDDQAKDRDPYCFGIRDVSRGKEPPHGFEPWTYLLQISKRK